MTVTDNRISAPHDFAEVNISTVYTAAKPAHYRDRVTDIIEKRFDVYEIDVPPRDFFPRYEKQEAEIEEIEKSYRSKSGEEVRGYRARDDAYRYARPDYMKRLAGGRKSSSKYSYAGFEQMVHLSSGIIRNFLESARRMYAAVEAERTGPVTRILPRAQNRVLRVYANEFLFDDLEQVRRDQSPNAPPADRVTKLSNLIHALGGSFRTILLSDRSERRIFSIAFSDEPDDEVSEVLRLGMQLGYFHVSTIGNKEGTGRTRLYILSRRLAPSFYLDPTSFAGYLFVTNDAIHEAMTRPKGMLRKLEKHGVEKVLQATQRSLFDLEP